MSRARFRRLGRSALLPGLLLVLAPTSAAAQSAADILREASRRYEERLAGVNDYTLVQEVMGFTTTTYFERGEDGTFGVAVVDGPASSRRMPVNDPAALARMAEAAVLEGEESVDGRPTHVVAVEDFQPFMGDQAVSGGGRMEDVGVRMWIDQEWMVPLRMRMEGTMTVNGRSGPVVTTMDFSDYREEQGLFLPFVTRMTAQGMTELMDISPEQMEQMRQGMRQFQEQMERMPEAQRAMMERMMGAQMERMREMLSSGAMDMEIRVTEVRVDAGPPAG